MFFFYHWPISACFSSRNARIWWSARLHCFHSTPWYGLCVRTLNCGAIFAIKKSAWIYLYTHAVCVVCVMRDRCVVIMSARGKRENRIQQHTTLDTSVTDKLCRCISYIYFYMSVKCAYIQKYTCACLLGFLVASDASRSVGVFALCFALGVAANAIHLLDRIYIYMLAKHIRSYKVRTMRWWYARLQMQKSRRAIFTPIAPSCELPHQSV